MKVLFHIDKGENWPEIISNLKNMIAIKQNMRSDIQVEVVVNGTAVKNLVDNEHDTNLYESLKEATTAGFKIMACNNSLERFKVAANDIFAFVEVVPVGVLEIVAKENKGFAYIRP